MLFLSFDIHEPWLIYILSLRKGIGRETKIPVEKNVGKRYELYKHCRIVVVTKSYIKLRLTNTCCQQLSKFYCRSMRSIYIIYEISVLFENEEEKRLVFSICSPWTQIIRRK